MAKVIDSELLVTNRGRSHQYPWDEWTDGQTYEVERGDDFDCSRNSFRNGLYSIAKSFGKKVVSMTLPETESIRFRFSDRDLTEDESLEDTSTDAGNTPPF